jgi:hypothetical protein
MANQPLYCLIHWGKRKFNQAKSVIFVPGWMDKSPDDQQNPGNSTLATRLLTPNRECYKIPLLF